MYTSIFIHIQLLFVYVLLRSYTNFMCVRIRTLIMFVYAQICSYTNTTVFVYKQSWVLTPAKFLRLHNFWKFCRCSYTNKLCSYTCFYVRIQTWNLFVYKQCECLYTCIFVRTQTIARSYTNELMFVYVYFYFSTRVRIRTYTCA